MESKTRMQITLMRWRSKNLWNGGFKLNEFKFLAVLV